MAQSLYAMQSLQFRALRLLRATDPGQRGPAYFDDGSSTEGIRFEEPKFRIDS